MQLSIHLTIPLSNCLFSEISFNILQKNKTGYRELEVEAGKKHFFFLKSHFPSLMEPPPSGGQLLNTKLNSREITVSEITHCYHSSGY